MEILYAAVMLLMVGFIVGNWVGRQTEAMTWRRNATSYLRKESAGRLYKVMRNEDYDEFALDWILDKHGKSE